MLAGVEYFLVDMYSNLGQDFQAESGHTGWTPTIAPNPKRSKATPDVTPSKWPPSRKRVEAGLIVSSPH